MDSGIRQKWVRITALHLLMWDLNKIAYQFSKPLFPHPQNRDNNIYFTESLQRLNEIIVRKNLAHLGY